MAKAIYCEITNVKKLLSRAVSVITIEVPIEHHKEIAFNFDEETVLITHAKLDQKYGIVESKKEVEPPQEPEGRDTITVPVECVEVPGRMISVDEMNDNIANWEATKKTAKKEKPLSVQAHLMISQDSFHEWLVVANYMSSLWCLWR